MIDEESANVLIEQGYLNTNLPALKAPHLQAGFAQFLAADAPYRKQYLQQQFKHGFDGYSYLGQEDSSNQGAEDLVETFVLSDQHSFGNFPKEFAAFFEEEWHFLQQEVKRIEAAIVQQFNNPSLASLQQALGLMISCNFYPAVPANTSPPNANRLTEHNDISLFTVFPFGTRKGLQVQQSDGEWVDVTQTDSIVVMSGFLLEYWSEGRYISTNHRVVSGNVGQQPRSSYSFFSLPHSKQEFMFENGQRLFTGKEYCNTYLDQF